MRSVIVIPTYNERENIGPLVGKIFSLLPEDVLVLVVDDNSPDGTADEVRKLQKDFPRLSLLLRSRKEGLGKAYIDAFLSVFKNGDVEKIVMMDADLSHDPNYLLEMFQHAMTHSVVIGSRYIKGGGTVGWELWRRILSRCGNFYCRFITRMPVHDCTGGFNIIDANLLRKIDMTKIDTSGYAFIMELKYALWKAGASFKEVPIIFKNRSGGESKISGHIISEGILAPWKMRFKKRA